MIYLYLIVLYIVLAATGKYKIYSQYYFWNIRYEEKITRWLSQD